MPAFIPVLFALGTVALLSGCAGQKPRPKTPAPGPSPNPNPPEPNPPVLPFSKVDLELNHPDGTCPEDGYGLILSNLWGRLNKAEGPLAVDEYLGEQQGWFCMQQLFHHPGRAPIAKDFVKHVATHDGAAASLSMFDVLYSSYHLYGENWGEDWQARFVQRNPDHATIKPIRYLGEALLKKSGSPEVQAGSRLFLTGIATYIQGLSDQELSTMVLPALQYYLSGQEPSVFSDYLHTNAPDFEALNEMQKGALYEKALESGLPTPEQVVQLFAFLNREEAYQFRKACFQRDALGALTLFEQAQTPHYQLKHRPSDDPSGEVEIFPNLPQNTPYSIRQLTLDQFLGSPVLVRTKSHPVDGANPIKTTLKKYHWFGNTEVFSIESGKPGPTTLVYAPHFHENNPRKWMHWIKDVPLQSGRIILMPEANRALWLAGGHPNPMNRLFNKALFSDRVDSLLVRRTEFLMGLVDGMIGSHDWSGRKPFFISDIILDGEGNHGPELGPTGSPYLPADVQAIQEITRKTRIENGMPLEHATTSPQVQWKIGDYAAQNLERLTGDQFHFEISPIIGDSSRRIDNSTAYMNFFLKKPAMTFEATAEKEFGQHHAMAVYSMLIAYGHQIHPSFEQTLQNPLPKIEPDIFVGLPVTTPPESPSPNHNPPKL